MVGSIREAGNKIEKETRFYISSLSSLALTAARIGPIVRSHWVIENRPLSNSERVALPSAPPKTDIPCSAGKPIPRPGHAQAKCCRAQDGSRMRGTGGSRLVLDASEHGSMLVCGGANGNCIASIRRRPSCGEVWGLVCCDGWSQQEIVPCLCLETGLEDVTNIVADTRRRWSEDEKASIVAEAANCPNISALARRRGLKPSLLFRWRREQCDAKAATPVPLAFVPVALPAPAPSSPPTITLAKPNMIEIVIAGGRVVRAGTDIRYGGARADHRSA